APPLRGKVASDACLFPRHGFDFNAAAMKFHEGPHDREAKSRAPVTRSRRIGLKPVENMVTDFGRNPASIVSDTEGDLAVRLPCRKADGLTGRGKSNRIREKIEEDLADPFAVGGKGADIFGHPNLQAQRRFG